jgi:hypothetical protein
MQGAAFFQHGKCVWKAFELEDIRYPPPSAISRGLQFLGVEKGEHFDEFEALELDKYRNLESLGYDDGGNEHEPIANV